MSQDSAGSGHSVPESASGPCSASPWVLRAFLYRKNSPGRDWHMRKPMQHLTTYSFFSVFSNFYSTEPLLSTCRQPPAPAALKIPPLGLIFLFTTTLSASPFITVILELHGGLLFLICFYSLRTSYNMS